MSEANFLEIIGFSRVLEF